MALVFKVVGISAAAAFASWFVVQCFNRANPAARFVWGIASRASWVAPFYLFIALHSGWALGVAVFMTLGLVHALRNLQPLERQKLALSSAWQVLSCVLAAAAIESGFIASARIGAPMIALATLIVAWHATRSGPSGHPARGLITVFLSIVLSCGALVGRVGVRPGDGFLGFPVDPAIAVSLLTLQKTFGGAGLIPFVPNRPAPIERRNSQVEVAGMAHRGIYLWPDVSPKLIEIELTLVDSSHLTSPSRWELNVSSPSLTSWPSQKRCLIRCLQRPRSKR